MRIGGDVRAAMRLGLLVVMVAFLAGCGDGNTTADSTPVPTPEPTPEATATPVPITLSGITWTTDIDAETDAPSDSVQQFTNDAPVIIAAVEVSDVPAGTALTATWEIDGVEVPEATMTVTTESTLVSGWATFRFTREDGHLFPLGDLSVTVSADDGTSISGDVEIVLPGA